jgi:cystathionine beta-synthase
MMTLTTSSYMPANNTSVLGLIGNTPLIRVLNIDTGPCQLFLKLESQNPGGSIKDRIGLAMVEAAEKDGRLKPGGTLVEATAGNTGLALALVAGQKGYRLILVIPDKMSQEKIFHLKALGAEVVLTRSDVNKGHPDYYQDRARQIAIETPGAHFVNQFENPANPAAHEQTTAPEIWAQMDHQIDAIVCGVGSGGTLTGLGRYFTKNAPQLAMILADPEGSILAPYVRDGVMVEVGSWLVEGIGEDFIPENCDLSLVKEAYSISDAESIATAREVLQKEGILCGSSSGTLIAAALRYCRAQTTPKRVVTFVCDSGNKYLTKIYNKFWLNDHGLLAQPSTHDLRDLIARSYMQGEVISVSPSETLEHVHAKMTSHDISQVPVIDNGRIVGLLDATDVLFAVVGQGNSFNTKVESVMNSNLVTVDVNSPLSDLVSIFAAGQIVLVVENERFLGLITPIDFLNYHRKTRGQG